MEESNNQSTWNPMVKSLIYVFVILVISQTSLAIDQKTKNIVRVKFYAAEEHYKNAEYSKALARIKEAEDLMDGSKIATLQTLKVKTLAALKRYTEAEAALDDLYELNPTEDALREVAAIASQIQNAATAKRKADKEAAEKAGTVKERRETNSNAITVAESKCVGGLSCVRAYESIPAIWRLFTKESGDYFKRSDVSRAVGLLTKACNQYKYAKACYDYAIKLGPDAQSKRDNYMGKACSYGLGKACPSIGKNPHTGDGYTPISWLEKGCDLRNYVSCNTLAYRYQYGKGVKKSRKLHKEYRKKACAIEYRRHCD